MKIGEAIRFSFDDKKWLEKMAIGAVLVFTVIGWIPLVGWMLEIVRRVVRGETEILPPWTNFGKLIVDGLIVLAIGFLWSLPIIVLSACLGGLAGITSGLGGDDSGNGLVVALNACLAILTVPYNIIVSFLIPPMFGVFAMQGTFGEAVNPAKAWRLASANLGGFVVAWLLAGLIGLAASVVGSLLCVIGIFPLLAYASAVGAHLYGQASREGMASLPAA
jgi:hypothetical protein